MPTDYIIYQLSTSRVISCSIHADRYCIIYPKSEYVPFCLLQVSYASNSRLSPISQTSNTPVSPKPSSFRASMSFCGGSSSSSVVSAHVPQCIPSAFLHRVSLNIRTASCGSLWMGLIRCLGSYAPMGMRPRLKGPRWRPMDANAGQTARDDGDWLGTAQ